MMTPKGSKRWRLRYRYCGLANMISLGLYPIDGSLSPPKPALSKPPPKNDALRIESATGPLQADGQRTASFADDSNSRAVTAPKIVPAMCAM
jgi:hypothetical protein